MGTGRKGGKGNYSRNVMCDRRINYKEKSEKREIRLTSVFEKRLHKDEISEKQALRFLLLLLCYLLPCLFTTVNSHPSGAISQSKGSLPLYKLLLAIVFYDREIRSCISYNHKGIGKKNFLYMK